MHKLCSHDDDDDDEAVIQKGFGHMGDKRGTQIADIHCYRVKVHAC